MWLVFFVVILIFGIYFSSIEAKLYNIYLTEKKSNYNVKLIFKLFRFFSIFSINLDNSGIKILGQKILYSQKFKNKRKIDENILELFFKDNNVVLKKFDIIIKIGLIDRALTNIVIVLISSIFPFYIKKRIDRKDLKYNIFPSYNKLLFEMKGNINITIKTSIFVKKFFKNIKSKITHNKNKNYEVKESLKYEWPSHRRAYENSNE